MRQAVSITSMEATHITWESTFVKLPIELQCHLSS